MSSRDVFRDVFRDEAATPAPLPMNGLTAASGAASGEPNRDSGGVLSGVDSRWRAIVENVSDMIAEVDEKGRYTFLSPSHGEVTGFAASDLIGRPSIEDVHPEDRPVLIQHLERLLEPGDQVRVRVRVRDAAGVWHWIDSAVRLRVDEVGRRFYVSVARTWASGTASSRSARCCSA
jgi:PAS domain S-box-containing protein